MNPGRMKILLTNDDGIYAEGLRALYRCFADKYSVAVIAPDRERSAVGHGITLNAPIRSVKIETNGGYTGHAVSGTPVDCVKLGLLELLDEKPNMVVSGINPGANVGVNINYSGTVAAAKEAALYGIPSVAVSIAGKEPGYYKDAARFMALFVEEVFKKGLPGGTLLNVNLPDKPIGEIKGVRVNPHATAFSKEYVDKRIDPRNRVYYWHGLDGFVSGKDLSVDEAALSLNLISITPIKCDATDYAAIEDLKSWNIDRALKIRHEL